MWTPLLVACGGCYLLKLAGLSVPHRVLEGARVRRVAMLLPVAMLAALVAVQTFSLSGGRLVLDARAGGLAAAVLAVSLRAPFLVVVGAAAAVTALLRLAA
jgi:hypothetical protein